MAVRSTHVGLVLLSAAILTACRATPVPAAHERAMDRVALLSDTTWPATPMGKAARRGHALLAHTPDSLPKYAHSALRCFNCHLDEGMRRNGLLLIGVAARYPQYRSRSNSVEMLIDRVNDCFRRSLNGSALPAESNDMRDIIAYLSWISRGVGVFDSVPGQGLPKLTPLKPDTAKGAAIFASVCSVCHGPDGHGSAAYPPLWGPRSFNIGAGMTRLYTLASFVRSNMPYDKPGSLSDQQAFDVAAFVASHPRPDYAAKAADWPNGDPPPDVAYPTAGAKHPAAPARTTPNGAH
jgi:thiosulfate dehydrogenase